MLLNTGTWLLHRHSKTWAKEYYRLNCLHHLYIIFKTNSIFCKSNWQFSNQIWYFSYQIGTLISKLDAIETKVNIFRTKQASFTINKRPSEKVGIVFSARKFNTTIFDGLQFIRPNKWTRCLKFCPISILKKCFEAYIIGRKAAILSARRGDCAMYLSSSPPFSFPSFLTTCKRYNKNNYKKAHLSSLRYFKEHLH